MYKCAWIVFYHMSCLESPLHFVIIKRLSFSCRNVKLIVIWNNRQQRNRKRNATHTMFFTKRVITQKTATTTVLSSIYQIRTSSTASLSQEAAKYENLHTVDVPEVWIL